MSTLKCVADQGGGNDRKVLEWRSGLAYWFGRPKRKRLDGGNHRGVESAISPRATRKNHMKDGSIILTHEQRVAEVAYLPTAGQPAVKNPPRRGRLPKGVVAMRKPREVAEEVPAPADPMDPLTAAYRMLDMMQCTLDVTRRRLAEYADSARRTG